MALMVLDCFKRMIPQFLHKKLKGNKTRRTTSNVGASQKVKNNTFRFDWLKIMLKAPSPQISCSGNIAHVLQEKLSL